MQIDNSFHVDAPPDRVYAFLLDVNNVARCMPGAELSEVVDANTFKGKVVVKVGPIIVNYDGVARIISRDEAARSAVVEAEGRETKGAGSAKATSTMTVNAAGDGSEVILSASLNVAGRVAQFGRGVMEDVSRRLVGQMADCIRASLEAAEEAGAATPGSAPAGREAGLMAPQPPPAAKPVNALALLFSVLMGRLKRLFGGRRTESDSRR
jgi:carbon monoxide dehydrogenase subunit G